MKVITRNSHPINSVIDLKPGDVFKVGKFGNEKVFMRIMLKDAFSKYNAVSLADGEVWCIDPEWEISQTSGTFTEDERI